MSMLHLVGEEEIPEDRLEEYFEDLYRIVCVSERACAEAEVCGPIRTTYLVDWEQLVHLLEDYGGFGEDIVEVARVNRDEAGLWRKLRGDSTPLARA